MSHFKIKDYSLRIATIHRLNAHGQTGDEIADIVGVTPGHVRRILTDEVRFEALYERDICNSAEEDFA